MYAADKDALTCDLAETYGVFDMKMFPASLIATLSVGLRDDSRIKSKLSGVDFDIKEYLLSIIADRLSAIHIGLSGGDISNMELFSDIIVGNDSNNKKEKSKVFCSAEAYEQAKAEILKE